MDAAALYAKGAVLAGPVPVPHGLHQAARRASALAVLHKLLLQHPLTLAATGRQVRRLRLAYFC